MKSSQFEQTLEQLLSQLPGPTELARSPDNQRVSCCVAIAGFEPRCVSALQLMAAKGWRSERGICVAYSDASMAAPNSKHRDQLLNDMRAVSDAQELGVIGHDDHNLDADFGDALVQELAAQGIDLEDETAHIVFDITVGSSRLLLEGLHALMQGRAAVTLIYSEASRYRPLFEEYRLHAEAQRVQSIEPPEFLTKGVDRVEVLRRIPGQNADARPTFLVVFPSFAYTRSSAIVDELSPSRVQWIFGVPHLVENRWRLDAQRDYHCGLVERSHRQCYVSTFDYRETLEVLEHIYQKRRDDYGVVVASLGSKLQKVGQVLFHLLRPEVAAVVSIPRIWDPDRFSSEEPRAVYSVSFGSCAELRESLLSTRRLRV